MAYAPPAPPAAGPSPYDLFALVDKDRSGNINAKELQEALSHGGWKKFPLRIAALMVQMVSERPQWLS